MTDISGFVDRLLHARKAQKKDRAHHPYSTPSRLSASSKLAHQRQVEPLPPAVAAAVANAWAPATHRRYDASIREFTTFCDAQKVAEEARLPASELLLATFAASLSGKCAGATIQNKIAAVKAWHIQNNVQWKGDTLLSYVLKGLERASPETSKQTRRPPVTVEMLEQLYHGLNRNEPRDAAIYAAATTAFYGQLRLGEICAKREAYSTFNPKTHSIRTDLRPPHTEAGSRLLVIPWTKVKGTRGEEVAVTRQRGRTDPIAALDLHLRLNEITNPTTALMSYLMPAGQRKLLTVSKFMERCNEIWKRHGHKRFTGHSFPYRRNNILLT
jgi:hypothetical protein